jgi:deoxyribodipyrimidine photolyase-related protein
MISVWVLGDQLNLKIGALAEAKPKTHRVLIIESQNKIGSRPWHIQRAHFLVTSMRRFALELQEKGFEVDYRHAATMAEGFQQHVAQFSPTSVVATEPNSVTARQLLQRLHVATVPSNQFLCHTSLFEQFSEGKKSLKMEDFYRWQRKRLGYLMDGANPVGGEWNFDKDNREPPPKNAAHVWPKPLLSPLDTLDHDVIASLPKSCWGTPPTGLWATSRKQALKRLSNFITNVLPTFGPHEDAMLSDNWHLAHSLLSPYLNNGLLLPAEVCDAVQAAYDKGLVPINSAEGFIRQIIGWREFIWNSYWRDMPDMRTANALGAMRDLPALFTKPDKTKMRCMQHSLRAIYENSYAHHIQRLMVLGNFALITGINPQQFTTWMWNSFIDAAEWVMIPNVVGMTLYADGGKVATKPYASGGAYIDRMSDYCKGCHFDRKKRVGDDACPFTTLYWDFMLRHQTTFVKNPRIAQQVRAAQRLNDVEAVQQRAADVLHMLDTGRL